MATAMELERWAGSMDARHQLPHVVRRLIRAENDQVHRLHMPGGEGVGAPGYDGIVETTRGTPFVPDALSVWEMGVGEDVDKKANADYKTRTDDPLSVDPATATFVFVTPRKWGKKKDWESAKRAEGIWADVRALDAEDIESALFEARGVHVWVSELLGLPVLGVQTIEDWWERFSTIYEPSLSPAVVLAGRDDEAADLLRSLGSETGRTFIRAASVDDGLAFVACAMGAAASGDQRESLLARSLLVHDGVSLRRLDETPNLLVLLPYEEGLARDARLVKNHHVVFIVTDGGDVDIVLPSLDPLALAKVLRDAGVQESDLSRYIRAASKSLIALQRVFSKFGQPEPAAWGAELEERPVRRAWLAGAWNSRRSGDIEAVESLTGCAYEELAERVAAIAREPDPLLTQVGSTVAVASRVDSWLSARRLLTESDLDALERTVQAVLSAVDPRLELPLEDRWSAAIYGKTRRHSSDLRLGLARTVALLGARGDEVRLGGGRTARLWSEAVASQLFRRANTDETAELWASLEDVLPLLAEGVPDMFLRAVDDATSGHEPLMRLIFQDKQDGFQVSSPHTGLLWALECVAWSPAYLGFAADVLARLAEIDPGGRLSNRPASSLANVFRSWRPQTAAPMESRLAVLDALAERHEAVAWELLMSLLPEDTSFGMDSHKPEFRDWASAAGDVTVGEFRSFADAATDRLLALARKDPSRWPAMVGAYERLTSERRQALVETLRGLVSSPGSMTDDERLKLWEALEEVVRKHRQFADARWSMDEEALTPLEELGGKLRPGAPTALHKWLFDEWHPDITVSSQDDFREYDTALQGLRAGAVSEILSRDGLSAVVAFAQLVELPWAVGAALAASSDALDAEVVGLLDEDDPNLLQMADAFVRHRVLTRGDGSAAEFIEDFAGRPIVQARLLLAMNDVRSAWKLVDSLGADVDRRYWAEFLPYGRGSDFPEVSEAARRLMAHDRVAIALDALSMYAGRPPDAIDVDVVVEALTRFGTLPDPETPRVAEHDITRLLEFLRQRGMPEEQVAGFEWKFLPILGRSGHVPSLERLLGRHPQTFVQLVALVFRPASAKGEPSSEEAGSQLPGNAYRLLREWKMLPGTEADGSINEAALNGWLAEARELLRDADRADIGELQIGEVLARAPEDPDGTFPALAVRNVLDAAPDDRLGRGFAVGLYNKRGVTSRGMTDGGQQEYELAKRYEDWASKIQASHPRTAAILRSMAESYREEGRQNDEEVRRFLEGLD
jgi:hypothetical protein